MQAGNRERVLAALNHRDSDRIPIDFGGTHVTGISTEAYERLKKYLGIKGKTILADRLHQLPRIDEDILEQFAIDTRGLIPKAPGKWKDELFPNGSMKDRWGVTWRRSEGGHYYPYDFPLKGDLNTSDLDRYQWPNPDDWGDLDEFEKEARALHEETDYAIVMYFPGRLMSLGCSLRGFENWLIDLLANQPFAEALMDRGLEVQLEIGSKLLAAAGKYIDVIHISDDLGTQEAPMISPELYRTLIKPRQRKLFDFIKGRTDARIFYHSDGCVYPFIPDFIEIGVDILNPVQVGAKDMEPKRLKREFGDHLCFWGGIDTQHILPFGTPKDVKDEVRRRIEELGDKGGYILSSVQNIQNEVPPENICAMFDAAVGYGKYSPRMQNR
ncbi:MAG: uroporphyrinogen decarboxylase family protein [Candidatus Hodarchaeota archaeon]